MPDKPEQPPSLTNILYTFTAVTRTIQQYTFDWLGTFWRHPKYGAVQFYTQYSYLTRAQWFVAPGSPKNAHLSMVYAGVRYVLPSTSGRLLKVPVPY